MSYCSKTIDQLLADAEPLVAFYSSRVRFPGRGIDQDDIAQYLRVEAWKLAQTYDADRKKWKNHISTMLRFRMIDAIREYGDLNRRGEIKRRAERCFTFTDISQEQDAGLPFDPSDTTENAESDIDFRDIESTCGNENNATRALLLRFRGFTMLEIATQFGVAESRISQMLNESSTTYAIAIGRVRCLAGEAS